MFAALFSTDRPFSADRQFLRPGLCFRFLPAFASPLVRTMTPSVPFSGVTFRKSGKRATAHKKAKEDGTADRRTGQLGNARVADGSPAKWWPRSASPRLPFDRWTYFSDARRPRTRKIFFDAPGGSFRLQGRIRVPFADIGLLAPHCLWDSWRRSRPMWTRCSVTQSSAMRDQHPWTMHGSARVHKFPHSPTCGAHLHIRCHDLPPRFFWFFFLAI